ncbi:MAG: penicillin-binding protein activator LpoB [Nitrospinae bacterium]|nr:penicillin-binding protein activator LpoB [Nitrospinota bacterium]
MKVASRLMLFAFVLLAAMAGTAKADKISIGVNDFTNHTSAAWWRGGVGHDLAGMLSNELSSSGKFKVVERQKLGAVTAEQDLAASGRVAPKKGAKMGKLTGADYLVTATVTAYEEDVAETGGGISFGGISVGGSKEDAYLAVDLRVIHTTTGDVEYSRTIEGKASGGGLSLGFSKSGFSGALGGKEKTPAGKAIRATIIEITEYLECVMVDKGSCVDKYKEKEAKRKKKTKESLKLDE